MAYISDAIAERLLDIADQALRIVERAHATDGSDSEKYRVAMIELKAANRLISNAIESIDRYRDLQPTTTPNGILSVVRGILTGDTDDEDDDDHGSGHG